MSHLIHTNCQVWSEGPTKNDKDTETFQEFRDCLPEARDKGRSNSSLFKIM